MLWVTRQYDLNGRPIWVRSSKSQGDSWYREKVSLLAETLLFSFESRGDEFQI